MEQQITPVQEGDKFILTVDSFQLAEIRRALDRINKQREHSQRYADEHRVNDNPKKTAKNTKPRLSIAYAETNVRVTKTPSPKIVELTQEFTSPSQIPLPKIETIEKPPSPQIATPVKPIPVQQPTRLQRIPIDVQNPEKDGFIHVLLQDGRQAFQRIQVGLIFF